MIKLDNVSFFINRNKLIFEDVNIFIPSGSIINIVGQTGSGKTSFLNLLSLLIDPNKGKIFLFGKEVNRLNRKEIFLLKQEMGLVFDNNYFIENMNVQENIIFPLIYKKEKGSDMMSALNELLPWLNLESVKKNKIQELSRTELKLVQFARSIIGRPRLLILDDFFLNMENILEKKIIYLLLALNKIGTTIIIIGNKPRANLIKFDKNFKIENKRIFEGVLDKSV